MVQQARVHIRRSAMAAMVLALAVGAMWIARADAVDAAPDIENGFVVEINNQRALVGLDPLLVNDGLTEAARDWAVSMMDDQVLAHAGDITTGVPPGWTKAGENVGRGESVDGLMVAFMRSPGHRRNVLDAEFTHVGVGSFIDPSGVLYTTHRFVEAPIDSEVATSLAASLVSSCDGGHGQVILKVTNNDPEPQELSATLGSSAEELRLIESGQQETFSARYQPDGQVRVMARVDGVAFFDETVEVSCSSVISATQD